MPEYELNKGTSTVVLYIGLAIIAIGAFMTFKAKPIFGGTAVIIIGSILSLFWFSTRNDKMCPVDPNDESPCKPI